MTGYESLSIQMNNFKKYRSSVVTQIRIVYQPNQEIPNQNIQWMTASFYRMNNPLYWLFKYQSALEKDSPLVEQGALIKTYLCIFTNE